MLSLCYYYCFFFRRSFNFSFAFAFFPLHQQVYISFAILPDAATDSFASQSTLVVADSIIQMAQDPASVLSCMLPVDTTYIPAKVIEVFQETPVSAKTYSDLFIVSAQEGRLQNETLQIEGMFHLIMFHQPCVGEFHSAWI